MSIGDSLLRQVEILQKALKAKESGLPSKLIALTFDDSEEAKEAAVKTELAKFGLDTVEEAKAGMCDVMVVAAPWAAGRSVGKGKYKNGGSV